MNIDELNKKLDPKHVKKRTQGNQTLSYIEGWHAIAEANRIFGFDGWSRETINNEYAYHEPRKIGKGQYQKDGYKVTYRAKVRIHVGAAYRDGCGTGHGIGADLGDAHESAMKEAETDAMKRALMTFGNPFGLALYDKTQENVGTDEPPPIHMDMSADDVIPESWLNCTLENLDEFAHKPKSTLVKLAEGDRKKRADPIFMKLNDPQRLEYEEKVKEVENILKAKLKEKEGDPFTLLNLKKE